MKKITDLERIATIQEHYRKETGKDLPKHVAENLHVIAPSGYELQDSLQEIEDIRNEVQDKKEPSTVEIAGTLSYVGITGLGSLYLASFIPTWSGKVAGGMLMWIVLFGMLEVVSEVVSNTEDMR